MTFFRFVGANTPLSKEKMEFVASIFLPFFLGLNLYDLLQVFGAKVL